MGVYTPAENYKPILCLVFLVELLLQGEGSSPTSHLLLAPALPT